ncbi:MAG: hypothetical protein AB7F75_00075 [Planctomycetota bacterium]
MSAPLIFCRDPGAARVLSSLKDILPAASQWVAKDAARGILAEERIDHEDLNRTLGIHRGFTRDEDLAVLDAWWCSLPRPSLLLTGTTHHDDMTDRWLWDFARRDGVGSLAVLDQWMRVRERFEVAGERWYPDAVAALSDDGVRQIKQEHLIEGAAFAAPHPHLSRLLERRERTLARRAAVRHDLVARVGSFQKLVVFASEPQKELHKAGASFPGDPKDQAEIFSLLWQAFRAVAGPHDLLLMRPHPKEDPASYAVHFDEKGHDRGPVLDGARRAALWSAPMVPSMDLLAAADSVIGVGSMFLLEALSMRRPVLSLEALVRSGENAMARWKDLVVRPTSWEGVSTFISKPPVLPEEAKLQQALGLSSKWREKWKGVLDRRVT